MKLSPTQKDALQKLVEHGALVRIPGGWWTWPGCPQGREVVPHYHAPAWSVAVGTIKALIKMGLAVVTDQAPSGAGTFWVEVKPTAMALPGVRK